MTFEFSGSGKLVLNCKAELLRGILKRTSLAELPDSEDNQLVPYKKINWTLTPPSFERFTFAVGEVFGAH